MQGYCNYCITFGVYKDKQQHKTTKIKTKETQNKTKEKPINKLKKKHKKRQNHH